MTKPEWIAIAKALSTLRTQVAAAWPPPGGYHSNAIDANARKLIYFAKLEAIELVAVALVGALEQLAPSFDSVRFLRLVAGRR